MKHDDLVPEDADWLNELEVRELTQEEQADFDEYLRRRERRNATQARRRERFRQNGPRERYTRDEIGERDGWLCHVCGDLVDQSLRRPDLESPSIDHVIPGWRGGPDRKDNVKIAHLGCNLDRNVSENPAYCARARAGRLASRQGGGG